MCQGKIWSKMAPLKAIQGDVWWKMCCFVLYRGSKGDGSTYLGNNNVITPPIMHSTAGYGGWFTPMMYHAHCTGVGLRLGHVHTTNKPHLSSSVSGPRPRRSRPRFDLHPSAIDHTRVRLNWTKKLRRENAPRMGGEEREKRRETQLHLRLPAVALSRHRLLLCLLLQAGAYMKRYVFCGFGVHTLVMSAWFNGSGRAGWVTLHIWVAACINKTWPRHHF